MMMRATLRRLKRRLAPSDAAVSGRLDGMDHQGLCGWATAGNAPAKVEIRSGDQIVMAAAYGLPRPDVAAAGAGPPNCGFRFDLARLTAAAARAMAVTGGAPMRLVVNETELASPLPSLSPEQLIEAEALAWVSRRVHG